MRSLVLTIALMVGSLGAVAITPDKADARPPWTWGRYNSYYYGGPYSYSYSPGWYGSYYGGDGTWYSPGYYSSYYYPTPYYYGSYYSGPRYYYGGYWAPRYRWWR
jgi:hypothetical protein